MEIHAEKTVILLCVVFGVGFLFRQTAGCISISPLPTVFFLMLVFSFFMFKTLLWGYLRCPWFSKSAGDSSFFPVKWASLTFWRKKTRQNPEHLAPSQFAPARSTPCYESSSTCWAELWNMSWVLQITHCHTCIRVLYIQKYIICVCVYTCIYIYIYIKTKHMYIYIYVFGCLLHLHFCPLWRRALVDGHPIVPAHPKQNDT